jgi:DNA helicase-2/ATP-dependent DNA helicase PcrA
MNLSSLNDKQMEAVIAPLGPVLVLAGAGSGKTRVLTYRIAYIIEQGLMPAGNILALTFTNKAAKEMQERVLKLLGNTGAVKTGLPTLGTFHSVCARILRNEIQALGYSRGFTIYDADDQLKVYREICTDLGLPKRFPPTLFRAYVSRAKNLVQTPEELNLGLDLPMQDMVQKVYVSYQNYLFRQNAVDFDDLLMLFIKILQLSPATLAKYQNFFKYILVDEYQDTNPAQYVLLQLLAAHRNLFVVGDDAQSIYGFRGSTIANILNFEKDFPEAKVIKLEQNYRSSKNILAVADAVIALNPEQKPKKLWTNNESGTKIWIEETEDERTEGLFVARRVVQLATGQDDEPEYESQAGQPQPKTMSILDRFIASKRHQLGRQGNRLSLPGFNIPQLPKTHDPLSQFAVLYRTHAQSRALEEAFIAANIPYQIVGGVKFYERKEIKDMLAYLRLIGNYRDLVSLKRVINEPPRGIGDKSYQIIKKFLLEHGGSHKDGKAAPSLAEFRKIAEGIALPPKQHQGLQQFLWLIEDFTLFAADEPLLPLMRYVFKKSGLQAWMDDGTEESQMRIDNVKELFTVAAKYGQLPWAEGLQTFLEEVALVTEIDTLQDVKDAVTMMTLHSAKGLEFDTVFFVGLEEGVLPHSRALLEPAELSEEIRLAYVGLTRARQRLFLVYARSRSQFGMVNVNSPSRILRVLRPEHVTGSGVHVILESGSDGEAHYEAMDF